MAQRNNLSEMDLMCVIHFAAATISVVGNGIAWPMNAFFKKLIPNRPNNVSFVHRTFWLIHRICGKTLEQRPRSKAQQLVFNETENIFT